MNDRQEELPRLGPVVQFKAERISDDEHEEDDRNGYSFPRLKTPEMAPAAKRRRKSSLDNGSKSGSAAVTNGKRQHGEYASSVPAKAMSSIPNAGFVYILDAPTSAMVRKGEDPITYLNKDQFYGLTLDYVSPPSGHSPFGEDSVMSSMVMVQFRERRSSSDCVIAWDFWHSRQSSAKVRVLDVDLKDSSGVMDGSMREVANNAVLVKWKPALGPVKMTMAIRCLSTDFTSQKGVKGIPLHLQIDTYEDKTLLDRAFCQIKTFCDKGAERKAREEEKKMVRHYGSSLYNLQVSTSSVFLTSSDLTSEPVLYSPRWWTSGSCLEEADPVASAAAADGEERPVADAISASVAARVDFERAKDGPPGEPKGVVAARLDRLKGHASAPASVAGDDRVMIYVRQENEEVFTPLHIVPPSVPGLVRAVCAKYQIDSVDIRYLFRRNQRGVVVRIDDDMIKYYSNGDVFIMNVLAADESVTGVCFYDVVFTDAAYVEANQS